MGIKYIPLIGTALLIVHIAFLLAGHNEPVTVTLAAILLVALTILLSIRFSFCALHKHLAAYMAAMALCICLQRYGLFGRAVIGFRIGMLLIGIALLIWAAIKGLRNDGCCEQ